MRMQGPPTQTGWVYISMVVSFRYIPQSLELFGKCIPCMPKNNIELEDMQTPEAFNQKPHLTQRILDFLTQPDHQTLGGRSVWRWRVNPLVVLSSIWCHSATQALGSTLQACGKVFAALLFPHFELVTGKEQQKEGGAAVHFVSFKHIV